MLPRLDTAAPHSRAASKNVAGAVALSWAQYEYLPYSSFSRPSLVASSRSASWAMAAATSALTSEPQTGAVCAEADVGSETANKVPAANRTRVGVSRETK